MPQYDPLLPSFQRSLPTLSALPPSTRTTTPTNLSNTTSPLEPTAHHSTRPLADDASTVLQFEQSSSRTLSERYRSPQQEQQSAFGSQPLNSPVAARPASLSAHISPESHTRALTSADRSTVHSPTQRSGQWQQAGGSVKREDDDAAAPAPAPGPSPSASVVPIQQYTSHLPHQSQYHYPTPFQESVPLSPHGQYVPQGPPSALPHQTAQSYPATAAPYPAYQQTSYSRTTVNIHHHHPYPSQSFPPLHAQHHPQHPQHHSQSPDGRCDCQACMSSGQGPLPPMAPPPLEIGRPDAQQYSWGGQQQHGAMLEADWQRGQSVSGSRQDWQGHQNVGHSQPPMSIQQHMGSSALGGPAYPSEQRSYAQDMHRWPNPQFDYGPQAPQMYHQPQHQQQPQHQMQPHHQPIPPSGPPPLTQSSSQQSVTWSLPQGSSSAGPSSPVQPPSPSSLKGSDKAAKHKSRKTWTEVEWKKLTDLAEKSKRGNPEADIDWDYVTAGFNGRRCRQGILTVAAKRGLKVSTREARTIGKRGRSTEEGET